MSKHVHSSINGDVRGTSVQTGDVQGDLVLHAPHPPSGSALWFAVPAVVLVMAAAALVGSDWRFVAGLVVAALVTGATGVAWWLRGGRKAVAPDLGQLSAKIEEDWTNEAVARDLTSPRPLRLRWRPTERLVQAGSPGTGAGSLTGGPEAGAFAAHVLAKDFVRGTRRQLVVLGEPGAGKTTLAVLFTIAAAAEGAVPVLLSASGWQPWKPETGTGEHVEKWIARRVREEYQSLAAGVSLAQLLPVLDGLDEMPAESLRAALRDLNRAAGIGLRMVITCRAAEFEKAVRRTVALVHADVVEVEPVSTRDAGLFLTEPEVTGENALLTRWDPVLARMADDPGGPVAQALSTPLMISLARRVYQAPCDDPAPLAGMATREKIETHLLDGFLATAYERKRDHDRARRWLSFLSHHLRDRVKRTDLEWWYLAHAVPKGVLAVLVWLVATAAGALAGFLIGYTFGNSRELLEITIFSAIVGLSVGLMAGVHTARTAHAPLTPPRRNLAVAALDGAGRDLAILVTALCWLAGCLLIDASTDAFVWWLHSTVFTADRDVLLPAALITTTVVSIVTLTNGVDAGRAGRPCRSTSATRALPLNLAIGTSAGVVVGSPWVVIGSLTNLKLAACLAMWLMTAVLVGVPLGVSRWLAAPTDPATAPSPNSVMHADRTATLLTAVIGGVCGGPAMALALWAIAAPKNTDYLMLSASLAAMITIVLFSGSGTAWLNYALARFWLAARGRLPWRLMRFLRTAHDKGVLRLTGPAHQLRHVLLREHLADEWHGTRRPRRRLARGGNPYVAAAVALSLLCGGVLVVCQRSPLRHVLQPDAVYGATSIAFSGNGSTVALVSSRAYEMSLWDSGSGDTIANLRLKGPSYKPATGLSYDGRTVTEALPGGGYRRLDVTNSRSTYGPGLSGLTRNALSPDGSVLAQGMSREVVLTDLTNDLSWSVGSVPGSPSEIEFSDNGDMIAVLSDPDLILQVTDVHGQGRWTVPLDDIDVEDVEVGGDGDVVAVKDTNGVVHTWRRDSVHRPTEQRASTMTFSHDSKILALGDPNGTVTLWDARTLTPVSTWKTHSALSSIAFSPDGKTLATAGEGGVATWTVPAE